MMTKKLTALTKEPKKRNDADICALPDGAHGFGGPVLDVRCGGKDRRWSCKVVLNGNRITVQLGTVEELFTKTAAKTAMAKARGLAKQGLDPREHLRLDRDVVPTFGQHAEVFMDDYVPTLKETKSTRRNTARRCAITARRSGTSRSIICRPPTCSRC